MAERARRGVRLLVLAVAVAVLASGCRFELDLNVTVERDGSGRVEVVAALDEAAVDRVGGDVEAVLALDDLVEAGWEVTGPVLEGDGFTRVRVAKGFADAEQSVAVLAEVTGDDGPFQGFGVRRSQSFARTEWRFEGRVDLTAGLEGFGDDELAAELDGEPIGRSTEELERQLGDSLDRLIGLRVSVRLPGDISSNAVTQAANGAVWTLAFGRGPADLAATGTERRTAVLLWAGLGALLGLALVLLVLVRTAVWVLDRRRTDEAGDTDEAAPERVPDAAADPPSEAEPPGAEPPGTEPPGTEPPEGAPLA